MEELDWEERLALGEDDPLECWAGGGLGPDRLAPPPGSGSKGAGPRLNRP